MVCVDGDGCCSLWTRDIGIVPGPESAERSRVAAGHQEKQRAVVKLLYGFTKFINPENGEYFATSFTLPCTVLAFKMTEIVSMFRH